LLVASLIIGTLQAPLAVAEDDVRYRLMPYLWTAGMDLEIGRPGNTRHVDVSFSDYVDFIDLGAAFMFEARGDRWLVATSFLWVRLGEEFDLPTDTTEIEINEILVEAFVGYRPGGWENAWLFGGVRYLELETDIDFANINDFSRSRDFADPYVGIMWEPRRGDWEYLLEADVGGGIDVDFAWSVSLGAAYHFNDRYALAGGYRFIDIDFEDDEFVFDGTMDGIQIGLMITF
jgi:opacity protein-like surface antigen